MMIPNDAGSLLALALKCEQEGFLLKALAIAKQGVRSHPDSPELAAVHARLTTALEAGIANGSVHVDRKPEPSRDPDVMFRQAEVFVKYDLREKAVAMLREVLELDPRHAEAKALLTRLDAPRSG
jgi:tetratricopeptide (TPR) repeat protein